METIVENRGFELIIHGTEMKWGNMFNMFTGRHLESPFQLTSLFYLGYVKNKNEATDKNGTSDLYKKIVEMEELKPDRRDYLGMNDSPVDDVRTHEFSPSWIKYLCRNSIKTLKKLHGPSVIEQLEISILDNLGSYTLEQLSTLKASSAFDESWYKYDPERNYGRKKAAEAVRPLISGDTCTSMLVVIIFFF